jgi:cellulose synthase/poly-beta-1,6-N-acetylglucosamine synthase-like glycosyltransferase
MAFLFIPALILLVLYVLLIGYYHKGFRQLKPFEKTTHLNKTKVTIIIPARNEEQNILNCLQSIAAQTYPKHLLQVIVVDDFSEDGTALIVEKFRLARTPTEAVELTVNLLQLKDFILEKDTTSHKKKGIEIAISKASGELIVCTDADCIAGENWISNIVSFYEKTNAQFIAAPVKLVNSISIQKIGGPTPLSFGEGLGVRPFQTIDFTTLQGITAASVFKKFHTMCNGANLAYTKSAFGKVNGFAGIDALPTGDDMLLMYKIAREFPNDVHYLKSKLAIIETATVTTWKAFFNQRIRWASKASYYEDKKIFYTLLIVYFLNVFTLSMFVSLFFAPYLLVWFLIFLIVKSSIEYWFLQPVFKFFNQQHLRKWFFVCIPFHIVYTVIAGWLGKYGKYEWKGRKPPSPQRGNKKANDIF